MKSFFAILFLGKCTLCLGQKTCPIIAPQLNWGGDNAILQWEISPSVHKGTIKLLRTTPQQAQTVVTQWNLPQAKLAYEYADAASIVQKAQCKYWLEYWDEKHVCRVTAKTKNAGDASNYSVSPPQNWLNFKQNIQYKIEIHGKTDKTVWIKPILQNAQHLPNDENHFYFRFGDELYRMLPLSDLNELIRLKIPLQNKPSTLHKYQIVLVQGNEIVAISDEVEIPN